MGAVCHAQSVQECQSSSILSISLDAIVDRDIIRRIDIYVGLTTENTGCLHHDYVAIEIRERNGRIAARGTATNDGYIHLKRVTWGIEARIKLMAMASQNSETENHNGCRGLDLLHSYFVSLFKANLAKYWFGVSLGSEWVRGPIPLISRGLIN